MASRRPQLSLDELRRLKWLLGGALALVSLWTVFFLDVEALALVGLAGAIIAAAIVWPQLPARLPKFLWRLAVPAIIAGVAFDFYSTPETLPVLIRLAILLVLYRAVSYRRKREDLQLIVLTLFLIVVAGVLTVSLGFAALLLVFTACALGFLFIVTLVDISEPPGVAPAAADTGVPGWAKLRWGALFRRVRQVTDWRLLAFASVLFAGVVGMSALLFMVIPRFEIATGFFLDRYITRKSRTGFTEQVRFGDVTELVRDESVAMRVDLTDAGSLRELPFWRVVTLDEYTPQGFRLSAGLKSELLRSQRVFQFTRGRSGGLGPNAVGGEWTFYIEPGVSRFLPLPGSFLSLRLRDPAPVQIHAQMRLVALRSEPMTMTAFQLDGVELRAAIPDGRFGQQLASAREAAEGLDDGRRYNPLLTLRGPEGRANQEALARMVAEIRGDNRAMPATEFAEKATQWLRDRHAYALSASIPRGDKDDIVKWLESNEPAFCEYFAGGLTVLCRTAGYPARVIAGFRGGALNAYENYVMVRNTDAHAWVEVFDGAGAWIRMDPTPGGAAAGQPGAQGTAQQAHDSSWSARWDSLRVVWYRRIVNFDSRQQAEMVEAVKSFTTDGGQALRGRLEEWARAIRAWLTAPWDFARAGRWLGAAALLGAVGWALLRLARVASDRWRAWRRPDEFDPVRREAGRWLLRIAGVPGRPPHAGESLAAARQDLERLRFGHRGTWPEPREVFRRARRALRAARG
ncbi:MAG TPA: DUF3488 and transglutaminase-like domain-containing protein [Opitutaceae bacterium]|nr:DUF3488 and transglutaminase-like domain-containing protein [Opitutaceae bacterium]